LAKKEEIIMSDSTPYVTLDQCKLITSEEYCALINPKFIGQTRVTNNVYYMMWESEGVFYKTRNKLLYYKE
jgi:hypothetical protein